MRGEVCAVSGGGEMSAVRLASDCPRCRAPLVRRSRKADSKPFLSCSGYPACRFAEDWDPQIARLASVVEQLQQELNTVRAELQRRSRTDLDRKLREVVAFAHPDRWPAAVELAHGITSRLNALRSGL